MSRAFEEDLIRHCAATLAGHKCASLFSCRAPSQKWLKDNLDSANAALSGKGLRACLVRNCERGREKAGRAGCARVPDRLWLRGFLH